METFTIFHNQFGHLVPEIFRNLLDDKIFTDVTLITSDDKLIQAHSVVLGSRSNFFKPIFTNNLHPNIAIYLKDVTAEELLWMMNIIYLG